MHLNNLNAPVLNVLNIFVISSVNFVFETAQPILIKFCIAVVKCWILFYLVSVQHAPDCGPIFVIRKMVHSLKTEGLRLVQNFYTIVVYSL